MLISASVYHLAFSSRREVEDGREEEFIKDEAEDRSDIVEFSNDDYKLNKIKYISFRSINLPKTIDHHYFMLKTLLKHYKSLILLHFTISQS